MDESEWSESKRHRVRKKAAKKEKLFAILEAEAAYWKMIGDEEPPVEFLEESNVEPQA